MVNGKNRDDFIADNLALVHSLCTRFRGRGVEYDDLYQAGCIGLIKAVDGFDSSRGLQFSTYAVPVILGEVRRIFRDGGAVKVSRSLKELQLKVARAQPKLEATLSRAPTVSELAEHLGVTAEEITEAATAAQPTLSLTYSGENGDEQIDIPVCDGSEGLENKILIDSALEQLDETERRIIEMRYYDYLTQSETAKRLCMTQVQISRAEKKILHKLRSVIGTVA